jgi:hypothetical protein
MKKTNQTPSCCNTRRNRRVKPSANWLTISRFILGGLAFVAGLLLAMPASAQPTTNMNIKPYQIRVEVQPGFIGTVLLYTNTLRIPTNCAAYATNYIDPVNGPYTNWVITPISVAISGAPSGCTASLLASDLVTPVGAITPNLNTNNTASNTNLIVRLVFDGTQASGVTTLTITATGAGLANAFFLMPLEVAKIWNGSATTAGNWTDSGQWTGGVPGPTDNVIFEEAGLQMTNYPFATNSIIDDNFIIASLRFAETNGVNSTSVTLVNTNWHNLFIKDGKTLAIKGNDGFSMLRDITMQNIRMTVSIAGTNGTLIQTNENSNFSMLADGQAVSILDMSALGNLHLDVNRVAIGDIEAYPNYTNLFANGYNQNSGTMGAAMPMRVLPNWNMALTNYVRAVYVDPYNYNNAFSRSYALEIGRNNYGGGSSAADHVVNMGLTNAFYLDSICVAGYASLGGVLQFQRTNSYALFRNTNGGRMSIFATADAAGSTYPPSVNGDNTKCASPGVDFSRGTVDILVDRLYLSMDRGNVTSAGKGVSQTAFIFSSGIIDANTAIFGYESQTTQTNPSSCYATVTVSNTAVLKVNGTLTLGYTAAAASDVSVPGNGYGQLSIGPGGTVLASNINIGGLTKASGGLSGGKGNNITLTSGATLIVSNTMGDANAGGAVGTLSFGGNCTNKLFIDGTRTDPYVFATNITASGVGNMIFIGEIKNISSYPATVHLIACRGSTPSFNLRMPPGFIGSGALVAATTFPPGFNAGLDLQISTSAPKNLVWRGSNGTWDNTTKNWLDQNTGVLTNFINGDNVAFDDNSGSTISLDSTSSPLLPTAINMTNNTLNFVFNGSGSIEGSATFVKQGTHSLEIDASVKVPVTLNQGSLTGTGTINGANTASGTTMSYGGNINGSSTYAGTATFLNSSIISGQLTVQNGGIVTNDSPSVNLNGSLSLQSGAFLYNTANGLLDNFPTGTIATNATLINAGFLGDSAAYANSLTVNGTLKDMGGDGTGTAPSYLTVSTMTIASGGTFVLGGDGIGSTWVYKENFGTFQGSVLLQAGSTSIFKVNAGTLTNTMLRSYTNSFGASSSRQAQNGCTLVISNVNNSTPLAADQYFRLFENPNGGNYGNTGSSTNAYPLIVPATPGPGLAWDLRYLWATDGSGNNGIIGVVNASSAAPHMTNSFTLLNVTNIVIQISWPSADFGWRLVSQNNPLTIGLSNNWTGIDGSWTNTTVTITNTIQTNSAVFYKLVFP